MIDQELSKKMSATRPGPGDIIAIETDRGRRYVQVTHLRAPYPDVVRAICPTDGAAAAEDVAKGETAFAAMVELGHVITGDQVRARIIGHAAIPESCQAFPTFRLPIRNRDGDILYWWTWDGTGLEVAPDAADSDLPIREVVPIGVLRDRLADLG